MKKFLKLWSTITLAFSAGAVLTSATYHILRYNIDYTAIALVYKAFLMHFLYRKHLSFLGGTALAALILSLSKSKKVKK